MRKGLVHKVIDFTETPLSVHGYDDEVGLGGFEREMCSLQYSRLSSIHSVALNGIAYVGAHKMPSGVAC